MNEVESLFMWKKFGKEQNSIAIQSTYKKLKESFHEKNKKVRFGLVNYIDYDNESIGLGKGRWKIFFHKDKKFHNEQELRIISNLKIKPAKQKNGFKLDVQSNGSEYYKVDISKMIENVYCSPYSKNGFKDIVEKTLQKYGIEKSVKDSTLRKKIQLD